MLGGGLLAGQIQKLAGYSAGVVELGIRVGETTENLERMRIALEADGLQLGKFDRIIGNWLRVMSDAQSGGMEYLEVIERLGLSISKLSTLGLVDQFRAVADAVSDMQARGENAAGTLAELMGVRSLQGLTALLEPGRFDANLRAAKKIAVPTFEEHLANKGLLQAFTDLTNTIRTSLVIALTRVHDQLITLATFLQRNTPAGVQALTDISGDAAKRALIVGSGAAAYGSVKAASGFVKGIKSRRYRSQGGRRPCVSDRSPRLGRDHLGGRRVSHRTHLQVEGEVRHGESAHRAP